MVSLILNFLLVLFAKHLAGKGDEGVFYWVEESMKKRGGANDDKHSNECPRKEICLISDQIWEKEYPGSWIVIPKEVKTSISTAAL